MPYDFAGRFPGRRWVILAAIAGAGLLLLVGLLFSRMGRERRPFMPAPRTEVLGFYENAWSEDFPSSLPTLKKNAELIDIVSPFWFSVEPDGKVMTRDPSREMIAFAGQKDIEVLALVNNLKDRGDPGGSLRSEARRRQVADTLRDLVNRYNLGGLVIDFEQLPSSLREEHTDLVAKVASRLRPEGKRIGVAVYPKVDVPWEVQGVHDYKALNPLVDFLVIMAYDKHWRSGPPGPIAPLGWTEANLRYALDKAGIPADKIYLAVGSYAYDWPQGGTAEYIPTREALARAEKYRAKVEWDKESRMSNFTYWRNGVKREVWLQDARYLAPRIDLAKRLKVRGIAVWRMAFEEDEYWQVIEDKIGPRR
ncbi:MAG: hypothetical protein HYY09_06230 [Firmicutes bacterium]|nr:hypothetical protein [Bacillota bacterium]